MNKVNNEIDIFFDFCYTVFRYCLIVIFNVNLLEIYMTEKY